MPFPRRFPLLVAGVIALTAWACSRSSEGRFIFGGAGARSREIPVEVVNDNFLDMVIYVMEGASNFRLGDVTGKNTATLTLRLDQISPSGGLRLLADPVGSREAYLSDAVYVSPGVTVVFHVQPALSQSYVILR